MTKLKYYNVTVDATYESCYYFKAESKKQAEEEGMKRTKQAYVGANFHSFAPGIRDGKTSTNYTFKVDDPEEYEDITKQEEI